MNPNLGPTTGSKDFKVTFMSARCLYKGVLKILNVQKNSVKSADLIKNNGVKVVDLNELRTVAGQNIIQNAEAKKSPEQLFWNLIYYFNEYHLPYEFILPYEDKQFEKDLKRYEAKSKKVIQTVK